MNRFLASIQLSDTDSKALIVLLVVLILLVLLIGLLGVAIRKVMIHQAKRADSMMHDVTVTHVVNNGRDFRKLGFKKNNRAFYRDSLWPFGLACVGLTIWIIFNLATGRWGENIFEHFGELFFHYKWDNWMYPPDDPLWVRVFGITVMARWPEAMEGYPAFRAEHIASYIEVFIFLVALGWYAYCCQAYLSRYVRILRLSSSVYEKSLEGYKASKDIEINPDKPLPPSE